MPWSRLVNQSDAPASAVDRRSKAGSSSDPMASCIVPHATLIRCDAVAVASAAPPNSVANSSE